MNCTKHLKNINFSQTLLENIKGEQTSHLVAKAHVTLTPKPGKDIREENNRTVSLMYKDAKILKEKVANMFWY